MRSRCKPPVMMLVVAAVLLFGAAPASATGPIVFDGPGQLFDPDRQLAAGERARVDEALRTLDERHGVQLFVVIVERLDGQGAQSWADRTAERNGLGLNDALLVIATVDRQYAWTVDGSFPLEDAQLEAIAANRIEPALRDGDWAGAAIAAAAGYDDALSGTGDGAAGSRGWWLLAAAAVILVIAAVVLGRAGRRTRSDEPEPDPLATMPLEELSTMLNARLVELDDALRTSRFDLDVATREFGEEATTRFDETLRAAEAAVAEGWATARPDDTAAGDADRRAALRSALAALDRVDDSLDDAAAEFEELRDRAGQAAVLLDSLRHEHRQLAHRLPIAAELLERLHSQHPADALSTVAGNVEEATARVDFARDTIASGEQSLDAGDPNAAALATSAAEEALSSAALLLDAIGQLEADLTSASAAIVDAERALREDLAEADQHLWTGDAEALRTAAEAARDALAALDDARARSAVDPLAQLSTLGRVGSALEASLASFRERTEHLARVRAMLGSTLPAARARVEGVAEFVTTRRGAIGAAARASLAEAQRLLAEATSAEVADPERSLDLAQRAHAAADRAWREARGDVDDYGQSPWGGGSGGNLGAMVLGGILLDSVLRGPRGGGYGGRTGGWSGGGGGLGPGSFGGSGGRRGGGGRF